MKTIHTLEELRQNLAQERARGHNIGLVPTMGNLHAGHIALVQQAKENADIIVSTIFVNPLQFSAGEDLDKYPRTLQADQEKLEAVGCHYLFVPSEEEVYPDGREKQTMVEVPDVSDLYCGASRPGHFQGVATIVCKLFGMVQPDLAIFGAKDYQQLFVIRKMTKDLSLPITIQGSPIVRNEHGLALSSRNGYLSEEQLSAATALNKTLKATAHAIEQGNTDFDALVEAAQLQLEAAGFQRDYFVIARQSDLLAASKDDTKLAILAAAYIGPARLLDNQVVNL
ncbi:pantoate--beta-alanine ligase [Neptunomonas japonica]|uniref:Pantothenate synthetase n=1 Tax=Neptunomonas japonica JAMM 1380 TaxID=1441457 RepID=A0A7R6SX95_9GAMM|nr:pantoate--beta-alanine ligase [Neptunomonas japonica]BBB31544.1 pantoate--beta-alanine ligase [Neptunomonas japonica JAMM 1380]